ncbi:hypothetical protein D7Y27_36800 [Corallococcus sp. AB004]|nr:hypothetical protein D7Y27_36800 [Corallococcus sp. AB004]
MRIATASSGQSFMAAMSQHRSPVMSLLSAITLVVASGMTANRAAGVAVGRTLSALSARRTLSASSSKTAVVASGDRFTQTPSVL